MTDRIVTCPNCLNESLLVRGETTWCFSGCSIFKPIDVPKESGTVPEPAPSVLAEHEPMGSAIIVRSAPTTSTPRPPRADIDDREDWSPISEAGL